jgi:transcription-repair coupling factor (superfamily II helicase)
LPQLRVRLLPDWETLPYDSFSPHHDLVSERLATLYAVMRGDCDVLLVPASTAVYRLAPPAYLAAYTFFLKQGEKLDAGQFRAQLTLAGYAHVTQVVAPGEYSIRGGLVDLFPMGSPLPYRLDLFDNEIESIKTFDVDNQRTLYPVPEVRLLPAREFPLDDQGRTRISASASAKSSKGTRRARESTRTSRTAFRPPASSTGYRFSSRKRPPSSTTCRAHSVLCLHGNVPEAIRAFWREAQSRYTMLSGERSSRPLLPPADLFLAEEPFFIAAKAYAE